MTWALEAMKEEQKKKERQRQREIEREEEREREREGWGGNKFSLPAFQFLPMARDTMLADGQAFASDP